jgi:hypothetical protein
MSVPTAIATYAYTSARLPADPPAKRAAAPEVDWCGPGSTS